MILMLLKKIYQSIDIIMLSPLVSKSLIPEYGDPATLACLNDITLPHLFRLFRQILCIYVMTGAEGNFLHKKVDDKSEDNGAKGIQEHVRYREGERFAQRLHNLL